MRLVSRDARLFMSSFVVVVANFAESQALSRRPSMHSGNGEEERLCVYIYMCMCVCARARFQF